jgi:hypothetical protein
MLARHQRGVFLVPVGLALLVIGILGLRPKERQT